MTQTSRIKFHYQYHPSHALWLIIFLLSFFLQLFDLAGSWRFNRGLVAQGDVWLLFSGHMVHLNWSHWLLNMAGLAIVAFFFSTHAGFRQWMAVILTSACVISAGLCGGCLIFVITWACPVYCMACFYTVPCVKFTSTRQVVMY